MATVVLWPGVTYQAKVKLGWALGLAVSNALMRSKLEEIGFSNVWVASDEDDLPADWPAELAGDGSGVRWVQATWQALRREMDIPSQVVRYRALPPPVPRQVAPHVDPADVWRRAVLTSEFVEPGPSAMAVLATVGVVTYAGWRCRAYLRKAVEPFR
jgi:hypothetical protein